MVQVLFLLNAAIGLLFFEWGWKKMHRFRHPNKDLNKITPAFRRDDAPKWKKWKFYPGALLFLVPRMLTFLFTPILFYFPVKLVLIGHKQGTPLHGFRRCVIQVLAKLCGLICNFCLGSLITYKRLALEDVDHYQEYVGTVEEQRAFQQSKKEDPRVPKRGPGGASVVTCNHTGWVEGFGLVESIFPSFAAREESKKTPVFGALLDALQTLYMPRGGT